MPRFWSALSGIVASTMGYFVVTDVTSSVDRVTVPAMTALVQDEPDKDPTAVDRFGKVFGVGFALLLLLLCFNIAKSAFKALKF